MPARGFIIFGIFLLFFLEFYCPGRVWTEFWGKILFSLFQPISSPCWLKIMPGRGFIIFWIVLLFFSEFSFSCRVWTEFWSKILFSLFRPISSPCWLKIMPGRGFIIFWIFLLFFWNILARVEYQRNSVVKFCFHFFDLSQPVLAKNNTGKRFYNFLNFFTIFFGIFFPGSSMNGILE